MTEENFKECGKTLRKTYFISNFGNCKSMCNITKREYILNPYKITKGYLAFDIDNKTEKVHRLVALNFIGERPDGLQIDHIDRDKTNNKVDNLRYVSGKINCQNRDSYRLDLSTDKKIRRCQTTQECYKKNKQIIIECGCGSITSKAQLSQHTKSVKHQKFLKS